ncbi:MAG: DNA-directed RNA polymerase subunit D [Nanobdellota archaeon]
MMEISVLEDKGEKKTFLMKGIDLAHANTLRRIIIEDVPVMAIEDVEIRDNSSVLYDEMIAQRLGLLPLKTDLSNYELPPAGYSPDDLNAKQKVELTLKAKGPSLVKASDLKSNDPAVVPVYPEMPIVKLLAGQEVEVVATAVLGKGKDHAKWSPALAYYRQKPLITINKKVENAKEVVENQQDEVFMMKNNNLVVNNDMILKSNLVEESVGMCKPKDSVTLDYSDDEVVFTVESWGQLTCEQIMSEGVNQLKQKCDEFTEMLK